MDDHDYNLAAFKDACSEDGASIELDDLSSPEKSINLEHTPLKAPHPKKKKRERNYEETAIESVLKAVMELKVSELQGENKSLKESFADLARYKRRWNLRLNGLTEKESEDTRELVIGILTRVVPLSVERLRETVDTVHRLGLFVMMCGRDPETPASVKSSTSTLKRISREKIERRAQSCGHLSKTHGREAKERF
ncbi:hypothetical protein WMY93_033935 [Mugilogobius chulae]|uniref:Uncharacterized protein n=1 Tax=Mugilogobius chulae TaxID=88201 RepID=A0AAW0MIN2_9GOBI